MLDEHQASVAAMILAGISYSGTRIATDVSIPPLLSGLIGVGLALTPVLLFFYSKRWTSPLKLAVEVGIIFSVVYTILSIFDQMAHLPS